MFVVHEFIFVTIYIGLDDGKTSSQRAKNFAFFIGSFVGSCYLDKSFGDLCVVRSHNSCLVSFTTS